MPHSELAALLQLAVNGLATGAIYALAALGLVLCYKATEVVNFAQGDLLLLGAFLCWGFAAGLDLGYWIAFPAAVALTALTGFALERGAMRSILGQPQFAGVMLTIGLAFMIRGAVSLAFGPQSRDFPNPFAGRTTEIGGIVLADTHLAILAATLMLCALLFAFLRYTRVGIAMQAAAQDQLAAYLVGIGVKQLNSLVWAISAAAAGMAGVLLAPIAFVDLTLWYVLLKALAAVVLGGLGSVPGAIVGGLTIGMVEQFAGVYLPEIVKPIAAYLVLLGVLIIFPHGLFGGRHGRRV
jgi:branched-chain amino acid transport system permease protein